MRSQARHPKPLTPFTLTTVSGSCAAMSPSTPITPVSCMKRRARGGSSNREADADAEGGMGVASEQRVRFCEEFEARFDDGKWSPIGAAHRTPNTRDKSCNAGGADAGAGGGGGGRGVAAALYVPAAVHQHDGRSEQVAVNLSRKLDTMGESTGKILRGGQAGGGAEGQGEGLWRGTDARTEGPVQCVNSSYTPMHNTTNTSSNSSSSSQSSRRSLLSHPAFFMSPNCHPLASASPRSASARGTGGTLLPEDLRTDRRWRVGARGPSTEGAGGGGGGGLGGGLCWSEGGVDVVMDVEPPMVKFASECQVGVPHASLCFELC
jgi:hypothetical protein